MLKGRFNFSYDYDSSSDVLDTVALSKRTL